MEKIDIIKKYFQELTIENDKKKVFNIIKKIFHILRHNKFNKTDFKNFNSVSFLKIVKKNLNENLAIEIIKADSFKKEQNDFFCSIYKEIINKQILSNNVLDSFSIKNKKSKKEKIKRQIMMIKLLSDADINSIYKITIKRNMMLMFDKKIGNQNEIKINEKDFKKFSYESKIPIIKYNDTIELFHFITEVTNESVKSGVLNREFRLADFVTNYNVYGQKINQINKLTKDLILSLNSYILKVNKNNNIYLEEFNSNNDYFNVFIDNIKYFQKNEKYFLAFKESILLLESYLRSLIKNNSVEEKIGKEIKLNKYKNKCYETFDFISENDFFENEKAKEKGRLLTDGLIEKKKEEMLEINSLSLEEMLEILTESKVINLEENEFLNYILLKNKNEGLDLRNKIFHGFLLEEDLKKEFHESSDIYLFFMIIYINFTIINISLRNENKKFVFKINKDRNENYKIKMYSSFIN